MSQQDQSESEIKEFSDFLVPLNKPAWSDPFRWLHRGLQDFFQAPWIGLFFGFCFFSMGWLLVLGFRHSPALLLALSAGFLLVSPLLCMGLYHVSHCLEMGRKPSLEEAVFSWSSRFGTLAIFAVVLLVIEMVWARASLVVFALVLEGPMPNLNGSLDSLFEPDAFQFVLGWMGLGAVFAGIIFSLCVVSIPMILHRGSDAVSAGLTSIRAVLSFPGVLALWALVIVVLTVLAMLPGFLGLLVVAPVLGHATWHAYRSLVAGSPPQ